MNAIEENAEEEQEEEKEEEEEEKKETPQGIGNDGEFVTQHAAEPWTKH